MRDFTRASGRLRQLPVLARVVYSIFIVFTLIALAGSAWLGADMVGVDLTRFDEYYAGAPAEGRDARAPAPRAEAAEGGPDIELPEGFDGTASAAPIPLRKLLEVTHFHLFSMPVYLMILSHLFMLSAWDNRVKLIWIGLSTLAVAAHLVAPWLARSGGAGPRAFYAGSGVLLGLTFTVLSVVPLADMWRPRGTQQKIET